MKKIKLGIVGFGNMGHTHAKNVAQGSVPQMELAAICDISEAKTKEAKELYPFVTVFENATDLFKSGICDVVIIAVPHYDHPALTKEAFKYNLNVITEKPAGVYTSQVIEMNEAADKSDKLFGIMYNQRTNPMYQKIRKMVQSGELGHIKRISWTITTWYRPQAYHNSGTWRSTWKDEGGGALINQNPHQLDLWQWMFGMPDKVTSFVSYGKYYDIEVEDDLTAFFEYENGTTGTYITSTGETPGTNRLEIACDMGRIVVENEKMVFERNIISERKHNEENEEPFAQPECWKCEIPVSGIGEQHVGILKDFANALVNGTPLLAPGKEGINGLTISNAIHYSSWTNKTVDIKNFPHEDFYNILKDKIKNSTVVKKNVVEKTSDTSGTY